VKAKLTIDNYFKSFLFDDF